MRRDRSDVRRQTSNLPRFIFYGGKGGVGKTTCAASRAVAEAAAGARVLVVSTDPAHSLGDALGVRLGARPVPVRLAGARARAGPGRTHESAPARRRRAGSLDAVELDAPRAFSRWISGHRAALSDAFEHGTWLDRADVDALLDLPLPGLDELVGMLEIGSLSGARGFSRAADARLKARAPYDVVIVDTAPTGHTLRLLSSPETVAAVADVLDALQAEHRLIRDQLARVGRPEAADRLIALLAEQARDTGAALRDRTRTTFCWVTLPEALSLAESEDAIAALDKNGMRTAEIVVNRVLPDGDRCPICDRRRADERRVLAQIRRRLGGRRTVRVIAAHLREPRGVAALAKIGQRLATQKLSPTEDTERRVSPIADRAIADVKRLSRGESVLSVPKGVHTTPAESLEVFGGVKLLFVGGKGGVGKTTVAAAAAVRLARAHPRRRMLLLSTDPAHSVADVFAAPAGSIGDAPRSIRGAPANLFVRELDAARALAARRVDLEHALDEIGAAVGAGRLGTGSRGAGELMDLAPPGVDELFGILEVVRLIAPERDRAGARAAPAAAYEVIIVDTAPTGHALRLLELPDSAREWVQVLMRVLLKYKSLVRPGQLAAELVEVSKSIRELQAILRDRSQTRFLVVTRAAEVPRFETERLLDRLRRLKLAAPALLVNAMTLAPGRCRRCRATAAAERLSLALLRRRCASRSRECVIIQAPLSAPPPRGARAIERWGSQWIDRRVEGKGRRAAR